MRNMAGSNCKKPNLQHNLNLFGKVWTEAKNLEDFLVNLINLWTPKGLGLNFHLAL